MPKGTSVIFLQIHGWTKSSSNLDFRDLAVFIQQLCNVSGNFNKIQLKGLS